MRERIGCYIAVFLLGAAGFFIDAPSSIAQTGGAPESARSTMPPDIDPKSGFRLPLPNREDWTKPARKPTTAPPGPATGDFETV